MKSSDKPEISSKWWSSEKPGEVEGKDLKKCLAEAEKAIADADKRADADSIEAAIAALAAVDAAAAKTIKKECDKKKHKDLIAVLEKFEKLVADETRRLEALQEAADAKGGDKDEEGDEEEEDKGILKPEYLERMIKQLRSGNTLQFCFGLNKQTPTDSRLLLCNKRKAERLFKIVKRTGEFSNRLLTYGTATGDGKVLQFQLADDAKEPSQIAKLAKEFLRGNKELKYKKLRVLAGGQTFEEDFPDDAAVAGNQADAGGGDLQQKLRSAAAAAQTWKQTRETIADQIAQLRKELDAFDDPDVQAVRERLGAVLDRYPDLNFEALAGAADQAAFDRSLAQTRQGITDLAKSLQNDPALKAIDENPFVSTSVVATMGESLRNISRELKLV